MSQLDTRILEWTLPLSEIFKQPLSRDVYYAWVDEDTNPWIAHVCRWRTDRAWSWGWAGTGLHTVMQREPLTLVASIGWQSCCGRHGYITNGEWQPSGEDGQGFFNDAT